MPTSTFVFWSQFSEMVSSVMSPLGEDEGETEDRVSFAEELLELKFPVLLREYYLRTANRKDINRHMNRLLSLDDLFIDNGNLIFFEENQCVCFWGIALSDLDRNNPPILQGQRIAGPSDELEWFETDQTLSGSLTDQLLWTIANGSADCIEVSDVATSSITVPPGWQSHIGAKISGLSAMWNGNKMVISIGDNEVVACGRTQEDIDAIALMFGLTFN
jgi:hypothetical protein